jgi:hypothetical protein
LRCDLQRDERAVASQCLFRRFSSHDFLSFVGVLSDELMAPIPSGHPFLRWG